MFSVKYIIEIIYRTHKIELNVFSLINLPKYILEEKWLKYLSKDNGSLSKCFYTKVEDTDYVNSS